MVGNGLIVRIALITALKSVLWLKPHIAIFPVLICSLLSFIFVIISTALVPVVPVWPLVVVPMASISSTLTVPAMVPFVLTLIRGILRTVLAALELAVVLGSLFMISILLPLSVFWHIILILEPLLVF